MTPIAPFRPPAPAQIGVGMPVLALLATVGMLTLVAFGFVVRLAVRQGESRRQAAEVLDAATWRCKAMRERQLREPCLERLRATPNGPPQRPS